MSNIKTKAGRRQRIKKGIRRKLEGTTVRPRLSVFKSNKAIYAQIIDDSKGHTVVASSSVELDKKGGVNFRIFLRSSLMLTLVTPRMSFVV